MKRVATVLLAFILISFVSEVKAKNDNRALQLIPQPQQLTLGEGSFVLSNTSSISFDSKNNRMTDIVRYLNGKISPATGFKLNSAKQGKIALKLSSDTTLGKEGYRLSVQQKHIQITANQPAGIFYGIQTLLQLLPPEIKSNSLQKKIEWNIPCVTIVDKPQFSWRGLMLDVSRHWFTKEEVKKYIDEMAEYKMNVFHWHLTDDQGWRIEIKSYPRLTEVGAWRAKRVGFWWGREKQQPGEKATYGGFYTQDDIKEVVTYAAERFIRVIPEIDVPGHSLAALVAYPELACFKAPESVNVGNKFYGEDENTLCLGKESTYQFLDKVITEVASLFPDEYIHLGGDECYHGFWHKCPLCQNLMKKENLKDEVALQGYFTKKMEELLKSKGKRLIGWDDILEGGLSPKATVMSWQGIKGGIEAAKQGHQVIMTPADNCYLDLYQGEPSVEPNTYAMCRLKDSYTFNPVPSGVNPDFIIGGQGNLWGESVPTFRQAEYMTWPRGWALAEVFWSGPAKNDWEKFWPRVEKHFLRYDIAKINYAKSMYNAIITPSFASDDSLMVSLSTEISGLDIYYTFDNTDPDIYTPKYLSPLRIPRNASVLRVITYRGDKQIGKVITLPISELMQRAEATRKK